MLFSTGVIVGYTYKKSLMLQQFRSEESFNSAKSTISMKDIACKLSGKRIERQALGKEIAQNIQRFHRTLREIRDIASDHEPNEAQLAILECRKEFLQRKIKHLKYKRNTCMLVIDNLLVKLEKEKSNHFFAEGYVKMVDEALQNEDLEREIYVHLYYVPPK